MKILFIVPMPPPITGHSLASKLLFDHLRGSHDIEAIDLSKDSLKDGRITIKRVNEVWNILLKLWKARQNVDLIYLTISESLAGNLKDLVIYLICYKQLSKILIHLHGGSLKKMLFDKYKFIMQVNKYFISRLGGAIISGDSHLDIFNNMLSANQIHIVPNFAEDYLFATEKQVISKILKSDPLKILFIGGLIPEKGFNDILSAYCLLMPELQKRVQLDFAGRFDSEIERENFIEEISNLSQVKYHGIVENNKKRELFLNAHVLCLPTRLHEGQPVSILEAYASGCLVLATGKSGIRDIFRDGVNGFEIKEGSALSIKREIEKLLMNLNQLKEISLLNLEIAQKRYRTEYYIARMDKIFETLSCRNT